MIDGRITHRGMWRYARPDGRIDTTDILAHHRPPSTTPERTTMANGPSIVSYGNTDSAVRVENDSDVNLQLRRLSGLIEAHGETQSRMIERLLPVLRDAETGDSATGDASVPPARSDLAARVAKMCDVVLMQNKALVAALDRVDLP